MTDTRSIFEKTGLPRMTNGVHLQSVLNFFGPVLGLVAVITLFAILTQVKGVTGFLSGHNLRTVATQTVIVGIASLGMTIVILSGGIDLSVGSVIALSSVVTAYGLKQGLWPVVAIACAIAVGALCGFLNGLAITRLKIVAFIATLGMLGIARGTAKYIAGEQKIDAPAGWLADYVLTKYPQPPWILLSPGIWAMLILAVVCVVLVRHTKFGREVTAIGSNEAGARLCGIPVERMKILIYTIGGAFAGLSGLMQFCRLTVGDPTTAQGAELDVIAAVVIGGGSLNGGQGSVVGSLVGAFIMSFLRNGCTMIGVPDYVEEIIIGVIIIFAVALDQVRHRRT